MTAAETFSHISLEEAFTAEFPHNLDFVVPALLVRLALEEKLHFQLGYAYSDGSYDGGTSSPHLYIKRGPVPPAHPTEREVIDYTTGLRHWSYSDDQPVWKNVRNEIRRRGRAVFGLSPLWIRRSSILLAIAIGLFALMNLPALPASEDYSALLACNLATQSRSYSGSAFFFSPSVGRFTVGFINGGSQECDRREEKVSNGA